MLRGGRLFILLQVSSFIPESSPGVLILLCLLGIMLCGLTTDAGLLIAVDDIIRIYL